MPIYEYQCHTCGKEFEIQAKISDEPPKRGRDCVSSKCSLEKIVSLSTGMVKKPASLSDRQQEAAEALSAQSPEDSAKKKCAPGCAHLTH